MHEIRHRPMCPHLGDFGIAKERMFGLVLGDPSAPYNSECV